MCATINATILYLHKQLQNFNLNVVLFQYCLSPFTLNPFQFNLEFRTTHRVGLCVVHPRYKQVQSNI